MATSVGVPQPTQQPGLATLIPENPILVWMLSLNRGYTADEYDACYSFLNEYFTHIPLGTYTPEDANSFRHIITQLLPILMMRHRRIPRAKWRDCVTPNGKHWIEQLQEGMAPDKFIHSMIGYHIQLSPSLCGMVMTQGIKQRVVNIGLGIKFAALPAREMSLHHYMDTLRSQITPAEISLIPMDQGEDTILRRLSIILALKEAYVHAIGQASEFDWLRLQFDVPSAKAWCDGHPLQGWEFRIWNAKLGVARGDVLVEELYVCVSAFFRDTRESTFIWNDERRSLQSWVQFVNIDQLLMVLPRLAA